MGITKRLSGFLSPLLNSHLLGFLVALLAFQGAVDMAAAEAAIPVRLGFWWQGLLLGTTPISCVVGCLVIFLCARVGNQSHLRVVRAIGRIPVLGRYFVFVGVACGLVFLEVQSLRFVTSASIESLTFSRSLSDPVWSRVEQQLHQDVVLQGRGYKTWVFFLKENRTTVLHALQKEHVLAGQ